MWPILIAAIILGFIFLDWRDSKKYAIPGPIRFPIIGNLALVLLNIAKNNTLQTVLEGFKTYGKVWQLKIFHMRIVYIADTEDLKHFFQTNFNNYVKGKDANEVLGKLFGDGIFNTDGEQWRVQRQTASSLFHYNNLQDFIPIFVTRSECMAGIMQQSVKSKTPLDIQQVFMRFTMDSIGELGFGINVNSLLGDKEAIEFSDAFDYVQEQTALMFFINPAWKYLPQRKFKAQLKIVDSFMENIINKRRQEIASGVDVSNRVDLLSRFISAKSEDGTPMFDQKYLLDVLKNFLIAGRDTTAITLTWAIYLLSQHRDVEERLLAEIKEVIGDDVSGVTYESIANLKYMRQVVDETLRLYPPVPQDERATVKDDVLPSGIAIPAGTVVAYSAYAQHRLEEYFPDPMRFNPDRWVTDTIKPYSFVPFHGGPRICLGQNMAYQEIKVALCVILPKFKFTLVKGFPVAYKMSLTMPAKNGIQMHVEKR